MCLWHIYCCRTFVNSSGWWCHNHLEKSWSESKLGWLSHSHILWKVIQFHCSKEPTRYLGIPHLYIYIHTIFWETSIYIYIYILTNQMVPKHQPVMVEPCWWTNVDDLQKITKKVTKNWPSRWSSDLFPLKSVDFVEPASYVNVGFC